MRRVTFDLDVLRSFVTGVELGSFARAAEQLGRSTSAVSAQLKKLEDQANTAIFQRAGRGLALTAAGETMLAYARRLLDLNDEATAAVRGVDLEGWVRLGLQEDFGELLLPAILGRFARAHPKVRIEARVGRNAELLDRVTSGRLDLALLWRDAAETTQGDSIAEFPLRWIGPAQPMAVWPGADRGEPLPLVAFDAPCLLRSTATAALDHAGLPWRHVFSSPSLGGLWAAVAAGLGVTIRTPIGLPATLRALAPGEAGLPPLPTLTLALHRAQASPPAPNQAPNQTSELPAARLAAILLQAVRDAARGIAGGPGPIPASWPEVA